ncbi:MAG: hypothetical protein JMDDDDMK_05489 [Acidobacteria bacterium]|nr:hypothetical protein [Acidobacteriota bacterium]
MLKRSFQMLAVSVIALCALTASASAQAVAVSTRVNVDFDFYAGKKLMPAGEYEFRLMPNHQTTRLVQIRQIGGDAFATISSVSNLNRKGAKPGDVVFNKYGDQHYLARVQLGDSTYVHDVIKSKSERKLLKTIVANNNQANNPTTGQ